MEPLHLKSDELNYELAIRGIFNVENQRLKTSKLRILLKSEREGTSVAPVDSSATFSTANEITICQQIYKDIINIVEQGNGTEPNLNACASRLRHLGYRINRIRPQTEAETANILDLGHCTSDALKKIEEKREIIANCDTVSDSNITEQSGAQSLALLSNNLSDQILQNISQSQLSTDLVNDDDETVIANKSFPAIRSPRNANLNNVRHTPSKFQEKTSSLPNGRFSQSSQGQNTLNHNAFSFQPPIWPQSQPFDSTVGGLSQQRQQAIRSRPGSDQANIVNSLSVPQTQHQSQRDYAISPFSNNLYTNNPVQYENNTQFRFERPINNVRQQFLQSPFVDHQQRELLPRDMRARQEPRQNNYYRDEHYRDETYQNDHFRNDFPRREHLQWNIPQNHYARPERLRKTVPVHQWRIFFSGDSKGIHLYDFLSKLSMYKRSEQVSDEELVQSIIHLLNGKALQWYIAEGDMYETWQELVNAMKQRFLPPDYDYRLQLEISNRQQKSGESFAEYYTQMKSLFRCLSIPMTEAQQVCILKKNILQKYAIGVASTATTTLARLTAICHRLDDVYNRDTSFMMPFQEPASFSRPFLRIPRPRELNTVDYEDEGEIPNDDNVEVCAAHSVRQKISHNDTRTRNPFSNKSSTAQCWNCQQTGHIFNECAKPRMGIFCFKCGSPDVIVPNCTKCQGNGNQNSGPSEVAQSSVEGRPQ